MCLDLTTGKYSTFAVEYLAEVFQDDSYVHVDDDKEGDDEVGDQVDDCQSAVTAVAIRPVVCRRRVTIIVHETSQHAVPPG